MQKLRGSGDPGRRHRELISVMVPAAGQYHPSGIS